MSLELAECLRSARALLHMNIKSVARALRLSDKTLTDLEKIADEDDVNVARLIEFYEDLGLVLQEGKEEDTGRIVGVTRSRYVNRLLLSAVGHAQPDVAMDNLCRALRHVGGLVYNHKQLDRTTAGTYDTIEVHFPIATRTMVREILCRWFEKEGPLTVIHPDGKSTPISGENVADFI